VNYFHLHNSTRVFVRQRFFLEQRMRKYLQDLNDVAQQDLTSWERIQNALLILLNVVNSALKDS
jgi:hypothetical protein